MYVAVFCVYVVKDTDLVVWLKKKWEWCQNILVKVLTFYQYFLNPPEI